MADEHVHPDDPLLLACRALARAMDGFDEAACRALRIGRSDLRALNLLEHGPLSPAVMADALGLSRPAVTALLDRLVRGGYVARSAAPHDRRSVRVALRPETYRAFAAVYRPLGQRVHDSVRDLDGAERAVVVDAMTAMTGAFASASRRAGSGDDVPPAGFEPAHPPPEGGALSPELRGPGRARG